jgi:hypothetical protein
MATREAVAEAVEWIVSETTDTGGIGKCQAYMNYTVAVASVITGTAFYPQCGSVYVRMNGDLCAAMVIDDGGLERGEFHCWAVKPGTGPARIDGAEIVDLGGRHLRAFADEFARRTGPEWTRVGPPIPDWIWGGTADYLALGIRLAPDPAATVRMIEALADVREMADQRMLIAAAIDRARVNLGRPPKRIYIFGSDREEPRAHEWKTLTEESPP